MNLGTTRWREGGAAVLAVLALIGFGCATGRGKSDAEAEKKARSHYDLGLEHLRNDNHALAIRELTSALEIDPEFEQAHYVIAEAYRRRQLPADAETHLRQALELNPKHQSARFNLAALYLQTGRYEEAIPHAKQLAEEPTFPTPWRALTNLGWAQFKLGRYGEARESLETAVEYRPTYWPALLNLGILEAEEGRRLEALARFQRVLELKPGDFALAETNYRMAEIYTALGNRTRAFEHLSASVEQGADSEWGKKSAEYLKLLQ